jgi:hypothetical protein
MQAEIIREVGLALASSLMSAPAEKNFSPSPRTMSPCQASSWRAVRIASGYLQHMLIEGNLTMGKSRVRVQHIDGPIWYTTAHVEG